MITTHGSPLCDKSSECEGIGEGLSGGKLNLCAVSVFMRRRLPSSQVSDSSRARSEFTTLIAIWYFISLVTSTIWCEQRRSRGREKVHRPC